MVLIPAWRISTRRLLVIGSVVAALSIASLGILVWGVAQSARPPHGGLTRAQAIQAAWEHVDAGAVSVASSEVRKDFNTGFDLPVHRWSWVVTFNGHWQLLCQGPCDRTTEWVAIDYSTGSWIASQYSYPAH
jgi:hypothetical protein